MSKPARKVRSKVIIATEFPLVSKALKDLAKGMEHIEIVGESSNGRILLELNKHRKIDLLILDFDSNNFDVKRTLRHIRMSKQKPGVLVYSGARMSPDSFQLCIGFGVLGYVLRTDTVPVLKQAIYCVLRGEFAFSPVLVPNLLKCTEIEYEMEYAECEEILDYLTEREGEVLDLVLHGHTSKEIAGMLNFKLCTATKHRENIRCKMKDVNLSLISAKLFRKVLTIRKGRIKFGIH